MVEISAVDGDGKLTCLAVQEDGSLSKSERVLTATQALKSDIVKHRREYIEGIARKSPWSNINYREHIAKSIVSTLLSSIAIHTTPASKLSILSKPIRTVISEDTFKKGDLTLAFESTRVSIMAADGPIKIGCQSFDIEIPSRFNLPGKKVRVAALANENQDVLCPSWFVRPSTGEEQANMTMKYHSFMYNLKSPDLAIDDQLEFHIPYLSNTRAIAPGDELVIDYWKSNAAQKKRTAPENPAGKKKAKK